MNSTTEICEDKERVKLRKEMLVQSKLEHCSVIGSYFELQISNLGMLYMDEKIRHRPKTFMWSPRFKRPFSSPNYSNNREVRICPAAQTLFSVQPILTFYSDKLLRIFTKSRVGHPLNNQSSNQQFQILAYKRRHLSCIQGLGCLDQELALALSIYIYFL